MPYIGHLPSNGWCTGAFRAVALEVGNPKFDVWITLERKQCSELFAALVIHEAAGIVP